MAWLLPGALALLRFSTRRRAPLGRGREPRGFHLEASDGLISHQADTGTARASGRARRVRRDRFQVAPTPGRSKAESTDVIELGREGIWVPDYRLVHRSTGTDVLLEVVGFWKRASLERLLRLLPQYGPPRFALAISDRLKVDEGAAQELKGPILRFKEIPNASELVALLDTFLGRPGGDQGLFR